MSRARRVSRVGVAAVAALLLGAAVPALDEAPASARSKCPKKPFVGTIERREESTSGSGQPAARRTTADVESAVVYDFGTDKNYTVYVGDYEIDPEDLGSTLTAPEGSVLVTIFLRNAKGSSLEPGSTLRPGKDPVSVIIDAGAGARAVTSAPKGKVTMLAANGSRVCFRIDYADSFQTVDGVVNAVVP